MKSKIATLALSSAIAMSTACGGPVSSGSVAGKTWSTLCLDRVASGDILTTTESVSFTETEMTAKEIHYKDNCATPAASITTVYSYEIGDEIGEQFGVVDNARKMTLTLKSVSLTLGHADAVTAYNAVTGFGAVNWACGKTDWAVSTPTDLLALTSNTNCNYLTYMNTEGVTTRVAAGQVYHELIGIEELSNDKSRLYLTTRDPAQPHEMNRDAALQLTLSLNGPFDL